MPLKFVGDAICLSGATGTQLKSSVVGEYYSFWWRITSGGQGRNYGFPTSIIELNAATGEVYIEDTEQTILGSAGHALNLKVSKHPDTRNLKIILIEENKECYKHLKKVISRRWPKISLEETEGPAQLNTSNVYLLNMNLNEALKELRMIDLGNALYFFDPLRSVEFSSLSQVAEERIKTFYKKGTEFFTFLFTSDWFLGRGDFAPLPHTNIKDDWTKEEKKTILEADELFGDNSWRKYVLNDKVIGERQRSFLNLYRATLHRWFRYVLPMPFIPKKNQIFHLMLCSNYEDGVVAAKYSFYASGTGNPKYSPNNQSAYLGFKALYPELLKDIKGNEKPIQWKILWKIIKNHEEGICDCMCDDLLRLETDSERLDYLLDWLSKRNFLKLFRIDNPWDSTIRQYKLNWEVIKERLGISPPPQLKPVLPENKNETLQY